MKDKRNEVRIALAGNPNVGKSTVFNALTGLRQHTGNWTGKTVETAIGTHKKGEKRYEIVDLPGAYSLSAHSAEEEVTRDFLCFEEYDCAVVVCDATRLARNLGFLLQVMEIAPRTVLVLNLMDEAGRLHLSLDTETLSSLLGIPVVEASAAKGKGISELLDAVDSQVQMTPYRMTYSKELEEAVAMLLPILDAIPCKVEQKRFFALRLLEGDETFLAALRERFGEWFSTADVEKKVLEIRTFGAEKGVVKDDFSAKIVMKRMEKADELASFVTKKAAKPVDFSPLDRLLMGKFIGLLILFLLLMVIFWLTAVGANYPSEWLSEVFGLFEKPFYDALCFLHFPEGSAEMLAFGIYRTLAWIVAVMLPPMLIFFPLFTILEDVGYLPRVAFNLDGAFCRCGACGKQGLCMCMGLGCNAVGVTGARIIDSKRERLIAIFTNVFMPCNGRFPAMIAVSSVFFSGVFFSDSLMTAFVLALAILFGVLLTFFVSRMLSHTLLRGESSSFLLEIPPFRRPQLGKILLRSFLDRTIFVLLRAIKTAIPAGILIWILSHIMINGISIAAHIASFLDPLGALMGLDGVILLAFLLGLPANEIVLPLCIMLYSGEGVLSEIGSLSALSSVLTENGWTWQTAVCFLLFTVCHFPCATTLAAVKKETGKLSYVLLAFLLPTLCGVGICMLVNLLFSI